MWKSLEITKTDRLDVTDGIGSQNHTVKIWCATFLKHREINRETQKWHKKACHSDVCAALYLLGPFVVWNSKLDFEEQVTYTMMERLAT